MGKADLNRRRALAIGAAAGLTAFTQTGPFGGADAKEATMTEQANKALVRAGFDRWRAGAGSPYELLADGAQWTIVGNSIASRTYPSREDFLRDVIQPFNARMRAPLVPTIRNLYADGDTVIAFFDAHGTARDGVAYANTYSWILEMQGGRIVRAFAFFDAIAFDDFWRRVKPAS